jgi:hypothetical protein
MCTIPFLLLGKWLVGMLQQAFASNTSLRFDGDMYGITSCSQSLSNLKPELVLNVKYKTGWKCKCHNFILTKMGVVIFGFPSWFSLL